MRVQDVIHTRRDLLKYGGFGLLGASVESMWPLKMRAASIGGKTNPRGSARNVVFYEISGAISHLDSFDFKDNPATPKDFEGTIKYGVSLGAGSIELWQDYKGFQTQPDDKLKKWAAMIESNAKE